jgi:hypothetical protein
MAEVTTSVRTIMLTEHQLGQLESASHQSAWWSSIPDGLFVAIIGQLPVGGEFVSFVQERKTSFSGFVWNARGPQYTVTVRYAEIWRAYQEGKLIIRIS